MKRSLVSALIISTLATSVSAQAPLERLGWLAGDWVLRESAQCTEEHWTSPSANMLVGTSRSVRDGRTVSFEFMRMEARPDGVFFVAQPGGRPAVDFKLSTEPGPELVFLNPGHTDHLTRVIYRRVSDSAMAARVEGSEAGKAFAVDYAYRRADPTELCH